MKNKLTIKLIITIVATVTLLIGVMAPIFFYLQPTMYIEQEKRNVAAFSDKLKEVEPFDKETISQFVSNSEVSYRIYIFDSEFEPLYTSYQFGNNKKFLKQLFGKKLNSFSENSEPYYTEADNDPSVRLGTCCSKNGKTYYIYIKDSHSGVNLVFNFSNKVLTGVVFGYIIICSVVLFFVVSPMTKTVRKITEVAMDISENNLSVRYQGKIRKDEIGDLALSVNKMADTLQENINNLENYNFVLREDNRYMLEYEQSRRMLLRNITHDLKTPLTVISSQVEMISTCEKQEKKDYYYQSAMEEINKMSKMISEVLQMTISERHVISKQAQKLDISSLVSQLCNNHHAYIKSNKLELKTDITHGLLINTIKDYIEFVFRNYLSNAVQNADKNTEITVSLKEHKDCIRLSVENCGRKIPDDIKDRIWAEAFTTTPDGKENTGLGLYIVKEISLKENTRCGFENTENGVRFWFDFIDCDKNDSEPA